MALRSSVAVAAGPNGMKFSQAANQPRMICY